MELHHTTRDEIEFLAGLGTHRELSHYVDSPVLERRHGLLNRYAQNMGNRSDWGSIEAWRVREYLESEIPRVEAEIRLRDEMTDTGRETVLDIIRSATGGAL